MLSSDEIDISDNYAHICHHSLVISYITWLVPPRTLEEEIVPNNMKSLTV